MKSAKEILQSHEKFHINLGLKRVKLVLALLDNPQKYLKFIHIAGTNGKGSTSKIINQILIEHFKNKGENQANRQNSRNQYGGKIINIANYFFIHSSLTTILRKDKSGIQQHPICIGYQ